MPGSPTTTERPLFADRHDAGRKLATRLGAFRRRHPVVVGIAPGGMPVAAEVARGLGAPLQAVAVEPLRLGGPSEGRFGAAAEGGIALFDRAWAAQIDAHPEAVDAALISAQHDLTERAGGWYRRTARTSVRRRHVLLVDDALQDEEIAAAAACALLDRGAADVTYATALVTPELVPGLNDWVEDVVCLHTLAHDVPPSACFADYRTVTDEETRSLLRAAGRRR